MTRPKPKPASVRSEKVWTIWFRDGAVRATVDRRVARAAIAQIGGTVRGVQCEVRRPARQKGKR